MFYVNQMHIKTIMRSWNPNICDQNLLKKNHDKSEKYPKKQTQKELNQNHLTLD